tara:strand:- start:288 stop:524 length:237 start_codon:yes stop_codon:yes gene_type:complete
MKFSNNLIANIARVLQIGILSGTDIVDQLRTFVIEENDGELNLTADSLERINKEIDEMLNALNKAQEVRSAEQPAEAK